MKHCRAKKERRFVINEKVYMTKKKHTMIDKIVNFLRDKYILLARFSLFVVYFWFGFVKLLGISPAGPLAEALTARTIGMEYFDILFYGLALVECAIGLLFLFPKYTRIAFFALMAHMILVCSPVLLLPDVVWQSLFVPTLEGQYIIKNVIVVALALAILVNWYNVKNKR